MIEWVPGQILSLVRIVAIGATGCFIQASPRNVQSYQQLRSRRAGPIIPAPPLKSLACKEVSPVTPKRGGVAKVRALWNPVRARGRSRSLSILLDTTGQGVRRRNALAVMPSSPRSRRVRCASPALRRRSSAIVEEIVSGARGGA